MALVVLEGGYVQFDVNEGSAHLVMSRHYFFSYHSITSCSLTKENGWLRAIDPRRCASDVLNLDDKSELATVLGLSCYVDVEGRELWPQFAIGASDGHRYAEIQARLNKVWFVAVNPQTVPLYADFVRRRAGEEHPANAVRPMLRDSSEQEKRLDAYRRRQARK